MGEEQENIKSNLEQYSELEREQAKEAQNRG